MGHDLTSMEDKTEADEETTTGKNARLWQFILRMNNALFGLWKGSHMI